MIKKIGVLVICSLLVIQGFGQSDKSNNQRPAFELKLFVNDQQLYNAQLGESNYIINDSIIQIFAGEKLFIEADVVNDKLSNFKVVKEIRDKSKTLVIDFQQSANGKVHEQMMLTIDNPFENQLNYKAAMNLLKNKRWVDTSVYPVMAHLKSIEMWPDLITSLALFGFEFKDK